VRTPAMSAMSIMLSVISANDTHRTHRTRGMCHMWEARAPIVANVTIGMAL